ncbi:tRNA-dihydrouridine synthase [Endomicrobiia bacterium]|nr:tRNA-dihydrouridine synthase [Endomicrobiia bacterium]GHT29642.1 tRNA-dihydrouridine synthase [Endomicrobiia bacterium]
MKVKKLSLGNIEFDNNIILAPMAGITDLPLRRLAKSGGAGLVYTGMLSARALVRSDEKTEKLLKTTEDERPVAAQIFGSAAHIMAEAAKIVRNSGVDIIDVNLGCPVKKVAKAGAGAKLLADEKLVSEILESVVKSVDVPVTVKIRTGLLPEHNAATEIIKVAYNCGIKMVAVHARPASQGHSGFPDLKLFAASCAGAKIPVIANGGVVDEKTAADFLRVPNCAGIMIGRGALGNYSIFKRLEAFFSSGKKLPLPSKKEKVEWLKKHVQYSVEYYGEKKGFVVMKKVFHYYVKDLPNVAKIRDIFNKKIVTLSDFNELIKLF